MFGNSKSAASLSSGLLARKGHARPAMRPGLVGLTPAAHEDLGWNDMGEGHAPAAQAPVPMPQPVRPVLRERAALAAEIAPPVRQIEPALPPRAVARIAKDLGDKPKAAFTLRLDKDRHLRLRLASAVAHRSAQQLVTEALDALLSQMPEVDALVAELPKAKGRKK